MLHDVSLPEWAVHRGRMMNHFPDLDAARTALLVIDMQRYFVAEEQPMGNAYARAVVPNINRIVHAARDAGVAVYWIRHSNTLTGPGVLPAWKLDMPLIAQSLGALFPGREEHDIDPSLDYRPGEPVIDKYRYSAFITHSSDLHDRLHAAGVDTIVVVGTMTNGCCEATVRDGSMIGYKVLAVSDAMATVTDDEHAAALLGMCITSADVVDTDEIVRRLAA